MTRYIVLTATAQVAGKARRYGRYGKVALVETDGQGVPAMISDRAKHMVRVLDCRDRLNMGGPNSAFYKAHAELTGEAARLNAQEAQS